MNPVATVIRCADLVGQVLDTLTSVERQTAGRGEIVLVVDPSTPAAARHWLEAVARARQLRLVESPSATPGAVRNAGIRATTAPLLQCVDAGDVVEPAFHATAAERNAAMCTCLVQLLGPGSAHRVVGAGSCDLDRAIGDTEAIHGASVFQRTVWEAVGGFDEALPALAEYDFWLRALASGHECAAIDRPLLVRRLREDGLYRRAWDEPAHSEALRAIAAKHAALFARHVSSALSGRELAIRAAADDYRPLLARRDRTLRDIDALDRRLEELRTSLPAEVRDGIDLGDLRRATPIARNWGYERGVPVDRRYIEAFLERHASDIRGAVLEVQEADYTRRFGGDLVTRSDVVDLNAANPRATIVADLRSAPNVASDTYDCVILTQTAHVVDDMRSVIAECARILKPGGVLLATLPSASRVCLEYGDAGDFWRVTAAGARALCAGIFPDDGVDVDARGNVLVNAAFLYGLACHELTEEELEAVDPYFPLLVAVRAQKGGSARRPAAARERPSGAAILLYHRVADTNVDVHGLAVPSESFRHQMAYLRDRWSPMPLATLVEAIRAKDVPPRAVAVTFDDGYVDNLTEAAAALAAFEIPATFFVTTDRLDEPYEFWWDRLERALLAWDTLESFPGAFPRELRVELPAGTRTFPTRTADDRRAAHREIYDAIVGGDAASRDAVVDRVVEWSGAAPADPVRRRMNASEMKTLAACDRHTIGAHSARHLMLPRQPSDVQRAEIDSSRRSLVALLGRRVDAFAYPFGAAGDDTAALARDSGFTSAVTCEDKPLDADADPLRLPRLEVTPRRAGRFAEWLDVALR